MSSREGVSDVVERLRKSLVRPISFAPSTFLPESLYHYTTAAGFAGILADGAIRATNFSFLNDPSELHYGRSLAEDELRIGRVRLAKSRRQFMNDVAERLSLELLAEVYVCCFTGLEDDLSQWRSYGSSAVERYALGFNSEIIQEIGFKHDYAQFARVLYEEVEQRERLQFVIERVATLIEREHPDSDGLDQLAAYTARHLARLLPIFKNPAYKPENEWRIILWETLAGPHPKYDVSRGVVRPFLSFELPAPLPLLDVYIMAPTRRELAMKATRMMLRTSNLPDTRVQHSAVPFAE